MSPANSENHTPLVSTPAPSNQTLQPQRFKNILIIQTSLTHIRSYPQVIPNPKRPKRNISKCPLPQKTGLLQRAQRGVLNGFIGLIKTILVFGRSSRTRGLRLVAGSISFGPTASNRPTKRSQHDSSSSQAVSQAEQERRQFILDRVDSLNIPSEYFNRVTNEAYYLQFPEQQGRLLDSNNPEDEMLRAKWYDVAQQILNFSDRLSNRTRSRLGRLGQSDLNTD